MITFKLTIIFTFTRRQFISCIFGNIVSRTLSFMTRFTKMSSVPTEPLSNIATEFAFVFYEILAVSFTILSWKNSTTSRTYQFFRIELTARITLITALQSSKIRTFTLQLFSYYRYIIILL